jgi:hypothetical protein
LSRILNIPAPDLRPYTKGNSQCVANHLAAWEWLLSY